MSTDWERITFLLRKDTYQKLQKICENEDRSLSYYIRTLVENHLKDVKNETK